MLRAIVTIVLVSCLGAYSTTEMKPSSLRARR
jgi:hypothetical protein